MTTAGVVTTGTTNDAPAQVPANKGFHPTIERDHSYIFIDGCMQAWPDADFAVAEQHGATAYCVTAWDPHAPLDQVIEGAMFWNLIARRYPNILVAERADDIRRAKRESKAALVLAAQGGDWVGFKLHRVEALYRLGLRMMLFAYNRTNQLCDGCLDRTNDGLSRFGQLVVDECNRVGMLIDCTHIGRRASLDIIERSSQPVVFSHSNPKAVADNPRNIDDEQIKSCVARGGVIGLCTWGPIVQRKGRTNRPTVEDFIDHVDYVAHLTGSTDHIGVGTDMSLGTYPDHEHDPWGEPEYPSPSAAYDENISADVRSPLRAIEGFDNYPQVLNLIDHLLKRGYSDQDIHKILGENFLRVFGQVWR